MFNLASNRRLLPAAIASLLIIAGCGSDSTTSAVDVTSAAEPVVAQVSMTSYSAPGSNWQYDFHDNGTYSITRSEFPGTANTLSVDGSYSATAAGFVSMTVDASAGTDAPGVDSQIWALEVPGFALLLSPVSTSDDKFISMVSGGECPNTDFSNNWITVRAQASGDSTSVEGSYFGSLSYRSNDGATSLGSQFALTTGNPDQGALSLGTGYCNDGLVSTATSDIYLAREGSASIRANVDDASEQTVFSLPKATIGSITSLDGTYAGILSDDGADLNAKVSPILVTCTSGLCTGDVVTNVDTGALAGQTFVIALSGSANVPAPGLTTGEFQVNGGSSNLACMVDANLDGNGNRVISCAGQSPTRDYRLLNLILASND
jgi:hypothetical protein